MRVDAHQHFWQYSVEEFGWIDEAMSAIRTDFLPHQLAPLLQQAGIDATVAVQARQSITETEWLLDLAAAHDWIAGVVGWVPLSGPTVEDTLEQLSQHPKLRGVRHVLQGEPDSYMAREDFQSGVARLSSHGLTYDLLVVERQLPAAIAFVDRHPRQPIVLDHLAKPLIASGEFEPWRTNIREIALRPNLYCKLSGMVTEAAFKSWSPQDLEPYMNTVLEAFGPDRVLFGSDWPVVNAAASYQRWSSVVQSFLSTLSSDEQASIFGRTAIRFYGLRSSTMPSVPKA